MKWIKTKDALPPIGKVVSTKIEDNKGARNFQRLKLTGKLWYLSDGSMYAYYTPTHWSNDPLPF